MTTKSTTKSISFLQGGGEMGKIMRNKDWKTSLIGHPETWPQSLRTTISIILNSKFPMFLFWGKDLICFYNDAYRPSLGNDGKHPQLVGSRAEESWSEIWDIIGPQIDQVLSGGDSLWFEDQLIPFYRNGQIEDIYWTYCYSAIRNDSGDIAGVFVNCFETTEKVLSDQNEKKGKKQLQMAVDIANIATWEIDIASNTFFGDARLKDWHGLSENEKFDLEHGLERVPQSHRKQLTDAIKKCAQYRYREEYLEMEYPITNPLNKIERVVSIRGKTSFDDQKKPFLIRGVLRDITAEKKAFAEIKEKEQKLAAFSRNLENQVRKRTEELNTANIQLTASNANLQRMNSELESFAYVSSHDLQEPLRKIQMFTSRIEEQEKEGLTANGKKYFDKISLAASRMRNLIDDLLAFSRTDNAEGIFEPTDLNTVVVNVLDTLSDAIETSGAKLTVSELPMVYGVPFQLGQVFGNLISNAIKFSKKGKIPLINITSALANLNELNALGLANDKQFYKITVRDQGIGFPQSMAHKIFEVFQRLHGKAEFEGTGIGLAIVKKIVLHHGGAIMASSNKGKETAFAIYLPKTK